MKSTPTTPSLLLALLAGWAVPGLGHVLYGRRDKGVYYFVLVLLAFVVGLYLGDWRVVDAESFGLYLIAQVWNGGPTLLALLFTAPLRITGDIPYLDVGLLYTAVAGLLNIVVLVDLYEIHAKRRAGAGAGIAAAEART